jgi:hypothetical protein
MAPWTAGARRSLSRRLGQLISPQVEHPREFLFGQAGLAEYLAHGIPETGKGSLNLALVPLHRDVEADHLPVLADGYRVRTG